MKKWTKKVSDYGTTGYFISHFYGEDLAQDPDYNETTNPDGYGGPKHPLKSLEKFYQSCIFYDVAIIDSSTDSIESNNIRIKLVSDGSTIINGNIINSYLEYSENITFLEHKNSTGGVQLNCVNINCPYLRGIHEDSLYNIFINSTPNTYSYAFFNKTININTKGSVNGIKNSIIINSPVDVLMLGGISDFNIYVGKLEIQGIIYNSLSDAKVNGKMLKSFDLADIGLRTNLSEDDSHIDNVNDWKLLFNNPIDVDVQNYMYADFRISSQLHQRIYDNQIALGKTVEEASAKATQGVKYVLHGGQYGGFIGAKGVGMRFTPDELWNTYKASSINLELLSGLFITTDSAQTGIYESIEIPLPGTGDIEMIALFQEVAYQLEGWVNARISQDDYEVPDSTIEQRTVMTFKIDFYSNNVWTGWKTLEVGAPARVDNAGNGNQDVGYNPDEAQVIPQVSKLKIHFEMRKHLTA